ncbi:MAG: c-type cytochrome [Aggregatilineales bacterium]
MTEQIPQKTKSNSIVLYITIGLAGIFVVLFLMAFVAGSLNQPEAPSEITAGTYQEEVSVLLADADVANGETLVTDTYECYVCHIEGGNRLAPDFIGMADRAAVERPPLNAEAYLYEALFYPGAHIVEGEYQGVMPTNYLARLSDEEAGDIIAYLLTLTD